MGDPYPTSGSYESRVYDAGRSVDWERISWNEVCPAGTDVSFQVAVSEDAEGPWSYGSALTTAAGTAITSTTGRYARFKLAMTGDGSDTPVVNDVQITHDGTSGSRCTRWTYDDAGNITQQARVTDAGTETDTRTYNNLNQLETSSGGWTYQYDLDGNLTGKNNGNTEGCEKWEYSWNENSRLVQVKKGVYDATPVLVNEFTVDYSYDEMGRMLRRDDGTDATAYRWDGWDLWRETTGESVTDYLVPDGTVQSFLRDGELYSLHFDALSSVRTVTDSEGLVVARAEYDAWGETLGGSTDLVPGLLPMGFVGSAGVRRDQVTGLMHMRNRWYHPQCQRFLSRDPNRLDGGSNLYEYPLAPMTYTDPDGLEGRIWLRGEKRPRVFKDNQMKEFAAKLIKSQPGEVDGFDLIGHGDVGFNSTSSNDLNKEGLWWDQPNDELYLTWLSPHGEPYKDGHRYAYFKLSKLKNKKYKFIRLYGCNTAGGHPFFQRMQAKYPKWADHYEQPPSPPLPNLAKRTSQLFPQTQVTGNRGPNFSTFDDRDVGWGKTEPAPMFDVPATYTTSKAGATVRVTTPREKWLKQ